MGTKKVIVFIIAFSFLGYYAKAQNGFTNRAEAKNQVVNGLKDGKWVEYLDVGSVVSKDTNAPYYQLTIYKDGKPYGIVREYHKGGMLASESPYLEGKKQGVERWYYEKGTLWFEIPFSYGIINGTQKAYYENGKLNWEIPYTKGIKNGIGKEYYEDGKLKTETVYTNDLAGATKNYDENGKEIK
jgi:antitoxin component YwqK of YwqJK toxin-antitoxin module